MLLSFHALFCEKYESGHGRRGGLKHTASFALPRMTTGILSLPVALQVKTRVMRPFAVIALIPRACRR